MCRHTGHGAGSNWGIFKNCKTIGNNNTFGACTSCSLNIELKEHEDAKWLTIEELDSVNWLPADVTLVDKIKGKQM